MSVATSLRSARRDAGLTQAELAARARVGVTVLSAYENGRREPSASTYLRLMAQCSVVPAWRRVPDPAVCAKRLLDVLSLADAMPHQPRPLARARAPWTA